MVFKTGGNLVQSSSLAHKTKHELLLGRLFNCDFWLCQSKLLLLLDSLRDRPVCSGSFFRRSFSLTRETQWKFSLRTQVTRHIWPCRCLDKHLLSSYKVCRSEGLGESFVLCTRKSKYLVYYLSFDEKCRHLMETGLQWNNHSVISALLNPMVTGLHSQGSRPQHECVTSPSPVCWHWPWGELGAEQVQHIFSL